MNFEVQLKDLLFVIASGRGCVTWGGPAAWCENRQIKSILWGVTNLYF